MNWLKQAYNNAMGSVDGMKDSQGLQKALIEYHDTSLQEAAEMAGHNTSVHAPVNHYNDIGGRPAPLNPNQFPTWEEMDAIRHYYGPQVMAEHGEGGGWSKMKGVLGPLWHELEGVASGDGWGQIGPDLYNNIISMKDELSGDDTYSATGLLNRLQSFPFGTMPKGEFEQFAKHALSRTIVPPVHEKADY